MKSSKEFGYRLFKPFLSLYFKLKFKPTIIGSENIPKKGPIIVCGNHLHVFDQCSVIMSTKRVIHYMAKEEYFDGPQAWFFKFCGCIRVDRKIHDKQAKKEAMNILENGKALGLFPEGTRNKTIGTDSEVDLLPFKYGAVSMAKKTDALIVPFYTTGNYSGKKGDLVTIIGEPFSVKDMDLTEANEVLRKKILELMHKIKK